MRAVWDTQRVRRETATAAEASRCLHAAKGPSSGSLTAAGTPAQTGRCLGPLKSTNHREVRGHRAPLIGASSRQSEAGRSGAPPGRFHHVCACAGAGTWSLIGGRVGGTRPETGPDAGRAHVCVTVVPGEGEGEGV